MDQYKNLLQRALDYGKPKVSRGYKTRCLFAEFLYFDLSEGFPLVTIKHESFKNIKFELLWFLSGSTDVGWLHANDIYFWDKWTKPDGTIGPGYGAQWRRARALQAGRVTHIDQVHDVVELLKHDPGSRRMIVNAWNLNDLAEMALPPCHYTWGVNVTDGFWYENDDGTKVSHLLEGGKVNVHVTMRSSDIFIGLPYNIASYALLTHLLARACGREVGDLALTLIDAHLYEAHVDGAKEALARTPYPLPTLKIEPGAPANLFDIRPDHLKLSGYRYHDPIKVEVME